MTELKTLKDLDFADCGRFVSNGLVQKELKREAIKWIKEDKKNLMLKNDFGDYIWESRHFITEWMKRLNINDGDLKCQ